MARPINAHPPEPGRNGIPMSQIPSCKTLELTLDLMARNSVTPEDSGCQNVMMERLRSCGFDVEALR